MASLAISNSARSGARLIQFRGGDTIHSTASSIAFLWSNWDVLFKISSKSPFDAEKHGEGIWSGGGYGASGEWFFATPPSIGFNEGQFEFFSSLQFLGTRIRGKSVFEYRRVGPQTFYYGGRCWGELPTHLQPLRWFIETLGRVATAKFNLIGAGGAEAVSREPALIEPYCDAKTFEKFLEMTDEEKAILSGRSIVRRYFDLSNQNGETRDPLGDLRRDLSELEQKFRAESFEVDLSEYQRCLDGFVTDPDGAVIKGRKILEPLVIKVFRSEFPNHTEQKSKNGRTSDFTTNDRIIELTYHSKNVPTGITAMMHTVNGLGNVGAHFAEGKIPNIIDVAQFKTSFSASLGIAAWYYRSKYCAKG